MTILGTIVLDAVGLLLILWLLSLVRLGRLYVGYGIILLLAITTTLGVASVPPARAAALGMLRALFPGAELVTVMWVAFVLILIYVLEQLTRIVNRLAALVQELALDNSERASSGSGRRKVEPGTRHEG